MVTELSPEDLVQRCDPRSLPFDSTADALEITDVLGQDRALEATRLALGIHRDGYNVFALGPAGVGKKTILGQLLERDAATHPTPLDWCYVDNVADPHRPRALRLPPGSASRLHADMERAIAELRVALRNALDRELGVHIVRRVLDTVRDTHRETPAALEYLAQLEADLVAHVEEFPTRLHRYQVHVIVDHGAMTGTPVIYEENPTYTNLFGIVEHVAETGALVADHTLVRAGALHRANGGYLLIDALALIHQPLAWEALKRALRTHEIRIESTEHAAPTRPAIAIEPEPIPLDLKVVLLGDRRVYYELAAADPELGDLFKVMADFEQSIERGPGADAAYTKLLAGIVRKEALRPLDRGALALVIEHAARLAGDAHRLTLHLRSIVDLLTEADDGARRAGRPAVTDEDVQRAIDARRRRAGRVRDQMLEAIRRKTVLIDTGGEAVGQINALSMLELAGEVFAYPMRITARARMGGGEVIDIERQVELGGPIHAKGVMILTGLLGGRYAPHVPLSLSATLVFEQSYGDIEGDSASLAELCALLSAIAELPLRQALAVTGSVDQRGQVQPIGGINEKIEGFFDVCRDSGLTGEQGVVIPRSNVQHLMLRADVVAAVAERRFHIHAVSDIDEAIGVVTGHEAGARDDDGRFPDGTVNALVDARLAAFATDARRFLQADERGQRPRTGRWTAQLARSPSE